MPTLQKRSGVFTAIADVDMPIRTLVKYLEDGSDRVEPLGLVPFDGIGVTATHGFANAPVAVEPLNGNGYLNCRYTGTDPCIPGSTLFAKDGGLTTEHTGYIAVGEALETCYPETKAIVTADISGINVNNTASLYTVADAGDYYDAPKNVEHCLYKIGRTHASPLRLALPVSPNTFTDTKELSSLIGEPYQKASPYYGGILGLEPFPYTHERKANLIMLDYHPSNLYGLSFDIHGVNNRSYYEWTVFHYGLIANQSLSIKCMLQNPEGHDLTAYISLHLLSYDVDTGDVVFNNITGSSEPIEYSGTDYELETLYTAPAGSVLQFPGILKIIVTFGYPVGADIIHGPKLFNPYLEYASIPIWLR